MSDQKIGNEKPVITFGVIADVQYGDIDDEIVYGRMRYYRDSLKSVKRCINDWKKYETDKNCKLDFILQLGDLIEGFRVKDTIEKRNNVYKILKELETLYPKHDFEGEYSFEKNLLMNDYNKLLKMPKIFHIYGNHELFGIGRKCLFESPLNTARILNQNKNDANYYYYDMNEKLRLICLDVYEKSILGYEDNHQFYQEANEIVHKNRELKEKCTDELEKDYLERFAPHGGAVSETQLKWLEEQLRECLLKGKKVLLAGHIPIKREAGNFHIVWNSEEILNLIWSFDKTVVAYLAGHYHVGGYYIDNHNIHHLTISAILETPQTTNSYATVKIYEDRIEFENISSYIGNLGSFTVNI